MPERHWNGQLDIAIFKDFNLGHLQLSPSSILCFLFAVRLPFYLPVIRDVSATLANGSPKTKARPGDTFHELPEKPADELEKPVTAKDIPSCVKR